MSGFAEWLSRSAKDERSRASLEEALIGDRFAAYARHRLRWVALSRSVALLVHLIEFAFLAQIFGNRGLAGALAVQNGCMLVGAAWWGGLELLRNRLQDQNKTLTTEETSVWLGRAALLAGLVGIAAGSFVILRARTTGFDVLGAYVLVVSLRLMIDLLARTFYSGMYARSRVYRPVVAILATELVGLLSILALWGWLGAWSFPIGLAISVAVSRGVQIFYTARAFEGQRIALPRIAVKRGLQLRHALRDGGTFVWAALAGASTRLGSILVLLVLAQRPESAGQLVVLLHLVTPLITTAVSWPQVFYLDFRRLDEELAAGLRRRLARRLTPLAVWVGLVLWLLGCAVVLWKLPFELAWMPLLALLPLFVAQSYLGRQQLQYFAQKEYLRVVLGGATIGCGLLLALGGIDWVAPRAGAVSRTLALVAAIGLGILALEWLQLRRRREAPCGHKRSLLGWLAALATVDQEVCVGALRAREARADQLAHLATWLAAELGPAGAVVAVRGRRILWFDSGGQERVKREALVVVAGGLADSIEFSASVMGGAAALEAAIEAGLIEAPKGDEISSATTLIGRFRELFPDGMVESLEASVGGRELAGLEPAVRRAVWFEALSDARGGRRAKPLSGLEVSTYLPGGEIAVVFAVARGEPLETRRRWRGMLDRANWHISAEPR